MVLKSILTFSYQYLASFSKTKLLQTIIDLREKYKILADCNRELSDKNKELEAEINRLKAKQEKHKLQEVNKTANRPTSKQPE